MLLSPGILWGELVALGALCYQYSSAPYVLSMSDSLQVLRITASAHPAKVIQFVALGERVYQRLKGNPVGHNETALRDGKASPVAVIVDVTTPEPAPCVWLWVDVLPDRITNTRVSPLSIATDQHHIPNRQ